MENYFDDVKKLVAQKKAFDKILDSQGICIICGHLLPMDLEYHHVGGKANSPIVISVCRNCHGRLSRRQDLWPDGWSKKSKPLNKSLAMLLRGISDILRLVADFLWEMEDES